MTHRGLDAESDGSHRPASSFRDPSGYVFIHQNRIFRAVEPQHFALLRSMLRDGVLADLQARGALLPTEPVQDPQLLSDLSASRPGYAFLEHERLDTVSYPYEWSVSMLADAAVLTIDLQLGLLEGGLGLKDGSAYNVQFIGSRPVFIDLTSIEPSPERRIWYALGQFQRMFTFPLLLVRYRGWDLKSYFLGAPDGRSERAMAHAWGPLERWRPALLLDVTLPDVLGRRRSPAPHSVTSADAATNDASAQRANLARLRSKVRRLARGYRVGGPWADYQARASYSVPADAVKHALMEAFFAAERPARVLDVGCNVGDYSLMAARHGAKVVAIDSDPDAIEVLYRQLREAPAAVTPLVVDIANPSPAVGLQYGERMRFNDRIRGDCVLALALLHHMSISAGLPLARIRDVLVELTDQHLVLEFIPSTDPMFLSLMTIRRPLAEEPTLERVRQLFGERCRIDREEPVGDSNRTLLFMRKR